MRLSVRQLALSSSLQQQPKAGCCSLESSGVRELNCCSSQLTKEPKTGTTTSNQTKLVTPSDPISTIARENGVEAGGETGMAKSASCKRSIFSFHLFVQANGLVQRVCKRIKIRKVISRYDT